MSNMQIKKTYKFGKGKDITGVLSQKKTRSSSFVVVDTEKKTYTNHLPTKT